jgi:drug/metabolite transporter (DMT)-like permease
MEEVEKQTDQVKSGGVDVLTLVAFLAVVILGGSNAVAVRFSNLELPPFWGAAIRFAAAALIFWVAVLLRRTAIPRGRALYGALIYGALTIGIPYAFVYWALVYVPASLAIVLLTFGPLFTFLLAWAHGQETFRWRSLLGAIIAITGILIGLGTELGSSATLIPLAAIIVAVAISAEGTVLYKTFPGADPLAVNSLALTTGAVILFLISLFAGETWILPANQATWIAYGYLVIAGSVLMFYSFLYVLNRWSASATSYSTLLIPVATIVVAAWLLDEQITLQFMVGSIIVVGGVWLGAISQTKE